VRRPPLNPRQWVWLLVILAAAVAGVWGMTQAMPDRAAFKGDWPGVAQWLMMLTIVGAGLVRLRLRPREAIRNILIWIVIAAVMGLGYETLTQMRGPAHSPPPVKAVPPPPGAPTQQVRLVSPADAPRL
jgi:hypothetical protein